jgi:hypothetical protein
LLGIFNAVNNETLVSEIEELVTQDSSDMKLSIFSFWLQNQDFCELIVHRQVKS